MKYYYISFWDNSHHADTPEECWQGLSVRVSNYTSQYRNFTSRKRFIEHAARLYAVPPRLVRRRLVEASWHFNIFGWGESELKAWNDYTKEVELYDD